MIRFENILEKVRAYHPDGDMELLRRAYVFSAREHRGQLRKSGEPYLIHPLEVANILAEMKLDVVCVVGGLLHDVAQLCRDRLGSNPQSRAPLTGFRSTREATRLGVRLPGEVGLRRIDGSRV